MSFIQGLIHPPAEDVGEFRGTYFNKEEIGRTLDRFAGVPLCVDHDREHVVGSVRSCTVQENGDIFVDAFVDDSSPKGESVMREIEAGIKKGLSMSYEAHMNKHAIRFSDASPIEVSIVNKGAIPRSRILAFGNSKGITLSKSGISEIFKMENTVVSAAAPPPPIAPNNFQSEEHVKFMNTLKELNITPCSLPTIISMMERCKKEDVDCVKTAMAGDKGIAKFANDYLDAADVDEFASFAKQHLTKQCAPLKLMASAVQNFHEAHEREKQWREKYDALLQITKNAQPTEVRAEERKRPAVSDASMENTKLIESLFKRQKQDPMARQATEYTDASLMEQARQIKATVTTADS